MNQLLTDDLARDHIAELLRDAARGAALRDPAPLPPRRGPLTSARVTLAALVRLRGIRVAAAAVRRSAPTLP